MQTFRIKTTIKCNNCVAKVKKKLDTAKEIAGWSIDLKSPDRILTVEAEGNEAVSVVERILQDSGYRLEII